MADHTTRQSTFSVVLDDASILRGTSTAVLLANFGSELRSCPGQFGAVDMASANTTFGKSFQVSSIDYFLSHSWSAPWLAKYLSLLLHFNGIQAVISGVVTWAVGSIGRLIFSDCQAVRVLSLVATFVIPVVILVFLQDILSKLQAQKTIFLDKVCIHQSDPILKAAGISSLGGFICNTKNLLVAWDATYFSRLWCTFEIAAFSFTNSRGNIIVLPVEMGATVAKLSSAGIAKAIIMELVHLFHGGTCGLDTNCRMALYFAMLVPYLVLAAVQREHATSLSDLQVQLSTYSVRQAECFCCANAHVHPATGAQLPCDREEVYASIAHWYGSGELEKGLDRFDLFVREMCAGILSTKLAFCGVPYRFILLVSIWRGLAKLTEATSVCIAAQGTHEKPAHRCALDIMYAIDTLMLREPMVIAVIFVVYRHVLGTVRNRPLLFQAAHFLASALVGLLFSILCIEVAVHCMLAASSVRLYSAWMCLETSIVWFMYFSRYRRRVGKRNSFAGQLELSTV